MGDKSEPVRTRSSFKPSKESLLGLVSLIEPTSLDKELQDIEWIMPMQEELNQFSRNDVWDLVPRPKGTHIIGTKWIFMNKLNEQGELLETMLDWLHKVIVKKRGLTIEKPLHRFPS